MSDELIKNLIETAEAKEREIGNIESYNNKTNLSFAYSDNPRAGERLNLNVVNDIKQFVEIVSFLLARKSFHDNACKELGVSVPFSWCGYTYSQWFHDIKNRIDVINLRKKKNELAEIKEQLNELMSPEMKRELKLKELEKKLQSSD